jgi:CBS-domain-containing membrane protein
MLRLTSILGIESSKVSHAERLVSGLGAFCGIFFVYYISHAFLAGSDAVFLVASMGASAVLLFAVPHSPLGQPWSLICGHGVSALVGVTCADWIDNTAMAAPLAVALAVVAMHYVRCIHPPGGATALMAVIGGPSLHALGYNYVLTPVLLNAFALLLLAITFNALFPWRRYPAYFKRVVQHKSGTGEVNQRPAISHEDFIYALSEMDSFIDVTENDLLTIYELATRNSVKRGFAADDLLLGRYYSNGKFGTEWAVRQIIDWQPEPGHAEKSLIYKTVAGDGRRTTGIASVNEFARWVKYEVYRDKENWRRVEPGHTSSR